MSKPATHVIKLWSIVLHKSGGFIGGGGSVFRKDFDISQTIARIYP
jgi:hypothetical protein